MIHRNNDVTTDTTESQEETAEVGRKIQRPGMMLYFDVRDGIEFLNMEERGQLFTAILDYAQFGIKTELEGAAGMAFAFMIPKIDKDAARYTDVRKARQYATYCRVEKSRDATPMTREEWMRSQG